MDAARRRKACHALCALWLLAGPRGRRSAAARRRARRPRRRGRAAAPRAPAEAIWGLSERIADSGSLPIEPYPALIDLLRREVGRLDRRGETVAMWVVPTVAAYGPFYASSAAYGLLVDGSWPGEFDVGDSDDEVLRLRFETGERPALRLFVFLGGPREVVDAYTALTGRPLRPPDWALRHWIWHDEHRVATPVVFAGVAMNGEVAEDLQWHEQLGLPAGVYLFDRPWPPASSASGRCRCLRPGALSERARAPLDPGVRAEVPRPPER